MAFGSLVLLYGQGESSQLSIISVVSFETQTPDCSTQLLELSVNMMTNVVLGRLHL